jgi:ABC-type glycerol-3-phosphate transport system substrate-binding protein
MTSYPGSFTICEPADSAKKTTGIALVSSVQKFLHILVRRAIALMLIVPAILILAFGPRSIDSPPKDKVVVDYWNEWSGHEGAAIHVCIDDFNRTVGEEKGIYVRCLAASGVLQKTLIATAAGVPPDIAMLGDNDLAGFAARDALMPLDDFAAARGITAAKYKKVFWDECRYDGRLYGLAMSGYDYALYMNNAKLRAAGLDPNKPPQTIAELDADAQKMDVIDPSGDISVAGYLPTEPGWTLTQTPIYFGGDWWDDQHQRFSFTDPRVIQSFAWVQSYSKRLGVDAITAFSSGLGNFDSPQNAFFAQKVAMEQQGSFFAAFIKEHAPDLAGNWSVAAFPSNNPSLKDACWCLSDVNVIPRGARHPREAFEFIAYMTRQDVVEKLANLQCKVSPLAQVSEEFLTHHSNPFIRVFNRLAASPNAHGAAKVAIMPEVQEEFANFIDRLVRLQVTPEEGLQQMQVTLQAKYDAFMEEQRLRLQMH